MLGESSGINAKGIIEKGILLTCFDRKSRTDPFYFRQPMPGEARSMSAPPDWLDHRAKQSLRSINIVEIYMIPGWSRYVLLWLTLLESHPENHHKFEKLQKGIIHLDPVNPNFRSIW